MPNLRGNSGWIRIRPPSTLTFGNLPARATFGGAFRRHYGHAEGEVFRIWVARKSSPHMSGRRREYGVFALNRGRWPLRNDGGVLRRSGFRCLACALSAVKRRLRDACVREICVVARNRPIGIPARLKSTKGDMEAGRNVVRRRAGDLNANGKFQAQSDCAKIRPMASILTEPPCYSIRALGSLRRSAPYFRHARRCASLYGFRRATPSCRPDYRLRR